MVVTLVNVVKLLGSTPRLYVTGVSFGTIARAFSLVLALGALVMSIVFVFTLPETGRLTLTGGLTFTGLLFTAASFFATAGRP